MEEESLKLDEVVVPKTIEPTYPVMEGDLAAYLLVVIGRFTEVGFPSAHHILISSYLPSKVALLFKVEVLKFGSEQDIDHFHSAARALIADSLSGFVEVDRLNGFRLTVAGNEAYQDMLQDVTESDQLFPYTSTILHNFERPIGI